MHPQCVARTHSDADPYAKGGSAPSVFSHTSIGHTKMRGKHGNSKLTQAGFKEQALPVQSAELLIDGYNLLHASTVESVSRGPTALARARLALLRWLGHYLPAKLRSQTIVVFDAQESTARSPEFEASHGLAVLYAAGYPDADALIAELVQSNSDPKRLTVVSSDHQVQRAARRRKANIFDSETWIAHILASHRTALGQNGELSKPHEASPMPTVDEQEIAAWMQEFADAEPLAGSPANPSAPPVEGADGPATLAEDETVSPASPFPPGYAEDLEQTCKKQKDEFGER